ncbi:hypothetical protein HOY80DRAFT_646840 [Tuber brumale]|nr:hypothetical protein HOY80DRAFT_646840 [Tuber brumale]
MTTVLFLLFCCFVVSHAVAIVGARSIHFYETFSSPTNSPPHFYLAHNTHPPDSCAHTNFNGAKVYGEEGKNGLFLFFHFFYFHPEICPFQQKLLVTNLEFRVAVWPMKTTAAKGFVPGIVSVRLQCPVKHSERYALFGPMIISP